MVGIEHNETPSSALHDAIQDLNSFYEASETDLLSPGTEAFLKLTSVALFKLKSLRSILVQATQNKQLSSEEINTMCIVLVKLQHVFLSKSVTNQSLSEVQDNIKKVFSDLNGYVEKSFSEKGSELTQKYETLFASKAMVAFAAKNGITVVAIREVIEGIGNIANLMGDGIISPWDATPKDNLKEKLVAINQLHNMHEMPEEIRVILYGYINYLNEILLSSRLETGTPEALGGLLSSVRQKLLWNFKTGKLSPSKQN